MYQGERFNSISHLMGTVLALAGTIALLILATRQADPWKIVSFSLYGASLFLLYGTSTLYHSLRNRAKAVFRKLDHLAIYLLIAGTYTPFALVTLRGGWGWSLFGIIWGLAGVGMAVEFLPRRGARILPVVIYLLMGWLALIALRPLLQVLPTIGFVWLLVGGLCYTFGIVFYALDTRLRHAHGVWHLFVLAGSICHYIAIFFYVA
ncbi:MAG: PAQR family membrane homeostasis protein TrhA [Sulfuricaulis sp.]